MRIISGNFKGKKILEPKNKITRPLKDLTKESIFNILTHSNKLRINLNNASVLDLFSGVGSFGIECLSRGVKKVVFIENYIEVLTVLKKNLNDLKKIKNYKIIEKNIYYNETILSLNEKFDIIFLDPPYKDKNLETIFENIKKKDLLSENGVIIIHRHKSEKDLFPKHLNIVEKKKYGISKIIFLN
tara:strand:+ start:2784 stop:3341 length:558 start_codon:yes stop_codon:yes gene_type:complete